MEQQKITDKNKCTSSFAMNLTDISNIYAKTQKSMHSISSQNIKLGTNAKPEPQFVISYNFQNDPNCQVRTHNLLIGLTTLGQSQSKKVGLRRNVLRRVNQNNVSVSKEKIKNSQFGNQSEYRKKLIQVRSNEILSNYKQNDGQNSTVKSFYSKNNQPTKLAIGSSTHYTSFMNGPQKKNTQSHEKYINQNITKIAQRRSANKNNEKNIISNSIQKISRNKINNLQAQKSLHTRYDSNGINFDQMPDLDILEEDQSRMEQKNTSRLFNKDEYNQKLNKILRKVKREKTRESLKNAYSKHQSSKEKISIIQQPLKASSFEHNHKESRNNQISDKHQIQHNQHRNFSSTIKNQGNPQPYPQESQLIENEASDNFIGENGVNISNFNSVSNSNITSHDKSMLEYQKSLIQNQNKFKSKRKYRQLLNNPIINGKDSRNSLLEEFHRIDSQNQNENGSSKKQSKNQINEDKLDSKELKNNNQNISKDLNQNDAPDKSIDFSINQHFNENQNPINRGDNPNKDHKNQNAQNTQHTGQTNLIKKQEIDNIQRLSKYPKSSSMRQEHRHLSNIDSTTFMKQRQNSISKRKLPTDYKQFLRLLSEENQRRREIQDLENEKKQQLLAKTSRFQNIEQQNQHIKRLLSPIGHSFMEDRRKRLSNERKSKSKKSHSNHINEDGFIIESKSQFSDDNGKKRNMFSRRNKKFSSTNSGKFEKIKAKSDTQYVDSHNLRNQRKQKKQVPRISQKLNQENSNTKNLQNSNTKAKLNSFSPQQNENQRAYNTKNNNKSQQKINKNVKKGEKNSRNDQKMGQQLTGIKIPQKAIEKASSKMNKFKNHTGIGEKERQSKNSQINRNQIMNDLKMKSKSPENKILRKQVKNQAANEKSGMRNGKNQNSKQPNASKSTDKAMQTKTKQNNKSKPIDKRVAKQKQRNLKNWKNSEQTDKEVNQVKNHSKKDKQIKQKDWKWANKKQKQMKERHQKQQQLQSDQTVQDHVQQTQENQQNQTQLQKVKKEKKEKNKKKITINEELNDQNSLIDSKIQNSETKKCEQTNLKGDQEKVQSLENLENMRQSKQQSKKIDVPLITQQKGATPSIHEEIQKKQVDTQLLKPKESQVNEKQPQNSENPLHRQNSKNSSKQNFLNRQTEKSQINSKGNQEKTKQKDKVSEQKQEKKNQMIKQVLNNNDMQENGFMEITESKFQIYNNESQKSIQYKDINQVLELDEQTYEKRAQIVKYLYSLPSQYQKQIQKFIPNQQSDRLISRQSFSDLSFASLKVVKSEKLRKILAQISLYNKLSIVPSKKSGNSQDQQRNILKRIFQPYQNENEQFGVWLFCTGVWRLITLSKDETRKERQDQDFKQTRLEGFLLKILQKAFQKAMKTYYFGLNFEQIKNEQVVRMITGLRVSILVKTRSNLSKIIKQIEYNTRKSHIIRASSKSSDSRFSEETINCIRKIESTPTGERVVQIVSSSISQQNARPKYFWIREEKFLEFFDSFTIISRRSSQSYWTNTFTQIKNQQKAVFMMDSTEKHTSGSITLYPLNHKNAENRPKCTITFYKEIEPQVLKLIGKATEKLPQSEVFVHTSKLYFEFNIKGTYFVFLQLEDGQYNVSIQSNSPQTNLEFVQFIKKQTMRNDQCEYVEIDKMLKKKPNINTFQNSQQFKQLMNFMKKKSPQFAQSK